MTAAPARRQGITTTRTIEVRTALESILVEQALTPRIGDRLKVAGRRRCLIHLEGMAAFVATVDTLQRD